jgi:hypothetical protein
MTLLPLVFAIVSLHPGEGAPEYRQPQLSAAHGQIGVAFGSKSSIWYAPVADGGRTLGAPVKVAEAGSLALGRHRGPRLAILPSAIVISAVVGNEGVQPGNLVAFRSSDKGRTWERAAVINDVPESTREGLHAMVADGHGRLTAVWLDLRAKGTRLYGSRSRDGGRTWSKNEVVYESPDGTICQCCHPSLTADSDGTVWVMWRNVIVGSRDLYLASSKSGAPFSGAQKLGTGTWPLNACPMDGGGVAFEGNKGIVTAWRRDGEIFLARPGQPEKKLGSGKDVALGATSRGAYAVWTGKEGLEFLVPGASVPDRIPGAGAFPSVVGLPDGSGLAAWEDRGTIAIQQLRPAS